MAKKKQRTGGRYRGRPNPHNNGRNVNRMGGGGRPGQRRHPAYQQDARREYEPAPENGEALPLTPGSGVLEMHPNGYGFLRDPATNFNRERTDPFVPGTMVEKFGLREGLMLN